MPRTSGTIVRLFWSCGINPKPYNLAGTILRYKRDLSLTVLCALVTVGISLYLPFLIREAIDGLTGGALTQAQLTGLLVRYAILAGAALGFSRYLRKLPLRLSHKVEYALRNDVFAHLTRLDAAFFHRRRTGDLITRMSSDMTLVRDAIGQGLLQGIRTGTVLIFASLVMLITDTTLALLVLGLYLPMTGLFFLVLRAMRKQQRVLQEQVSDVSNFCQESFAGIRCIKGFALEERRIGLFEFINRDLVRLHMRVQAGRQSLWPFMAFWFCLSVMLILNVGGRQVIRGERSLGTLVQFIQYLLYMQWPLLALSWITSLMQRGRVSWHRIREILEQEPAIRDAEVTDASITTLQGDIRLHDICLDLEGRRLLDHVDLHIPPGRTVGFTGPTGAGKTLLVSLVARLLDPTAGTLIIDGHDIRTIPLHVLRRHIGFAAQEPVLFSRSLQHNIGFGVSEPDDRLIDWAAHIAHLKQDINAFPEKYETRLGERGVTLSGGQRQRTSISRAVARHPEILILDDVLSAVDTQTEAAILEKLQPVMQKRTTLFVSHRVSTLRYADEIVVIEHGRITQRGSHAQLLAQDGYYAELNTLQQIQHDMEETH